MNRLQKSVHQYFRGTKKYSPDMKQQFLEQSTDQSWVRTLMCIIMVFFVEISNLIIELKADLHSDEAWSIYLVGIILMISISLIYSVLFLIVRFRPTTSYRIKRAIVYTCWLLMLTVSMIFTYGEMTEGRSLTNLTLFMLAFGMVPILSLREYFPALLGYTACNLLLALERGITPDFIQYIIVMAMLSFFFSAVQFINAQELSIERFHLEKMNGKLETLVADAVNKANEANAVKSDFLARISHDMRTPMNGIIGLLHLTKQEEMSDKARENLTRMETAGLYMLNLINDTLDMRKIEQGLIQLNYEEVDSIEFMNAVVATVQPSIHEKEIEFIFQKKNISEARLRIDAVRIQQIFTNILSNAVKFTPRGGKVECIIECMERDDKVTHDRIIVRDNGIGMSEEFLPHLFEPFMQEDNGVSNYAGSGLGMAIVKSLIDMMGGTIEIKSERGKGTEITVCLDFALAPEKKREDSPAFEEAEYRFWTGKHILVCEDNELNLEIATKMLENKGCIVDGAENGRLGVEKFKESAPFYYSLILMDIRMPVMNGLEAAQAIRQLPREDAKTVKIFAMSANAFDEDKEKSIQAGMDDHLVKPIEAKKFYARIHEVLAGEEQ